MSIPEVSIIIPCFNHAHFLQSSIESCIKLDIPQKEIILIDDGSTDYTRSISSSYPQVRYIYQENQGLPAARNTGARHARGKFICFLDADDWLITEGFLQNLEFLRNNSQFAFVSGCHIIRNQDGTDFLYCIKDVPDNSYDFLLQGNYIGNPAAVIFKKETVEQYPFDTSPEIFGCEDYDQYLNITKAHQVAHRPIPVSYYRRHTNNMSNNKTMMLNSVLNVLGRQKRSGLSAYQMELVKKGIAHWMYHYDYINFIDNGTISFNKNHWELLKKYNIKLPLVLFQKLRKTMHKDAATS